MLKPYLDSKLPEALDLLRQMVDINSFTINKEGVNRLARFTADAQWAGLKTQDDFDKFVTSQSAPSPQSH